MNDVFAIHDPTGVAAGLLARARAEHSGEIDAPLALAPGSVDEAISLGFPVRRDEAVAIVSLRGYMLGSPSPALRKFGFASTSMTAKAVRAATADPTIRAIVLDVDSPGGSTSNVDHLSDAVFAASVAKPTVAVADGYMASGGYFAAAGASEIVASRMSTVGSIGVIVVLADYSKLDEKIGIRFKPITTGFAKSTGVGEITDEQIAAVQRYVDDLMSEFREAVMTGRRMDKDAFGRVGTGEIWTGARGVEMGLVDRIGTLDDVVEDLKRRAGEVDSRARLRSQSSSLALQRVDFV